MLWSSTVDVIEQLLVLVLNRSSSHVSFGGRAREGVALDNDDVFGRGDALVDVVARVELFRPSNDLVLELLAVHGALLRNLDEQGRRRSTISNNDTFKNKFTACGADVVLD